jgi:hypothetical protein
MSSINNFAWSQDFYLITVGVCATFFDRNYWQVSAFSFIGSDVVLIDMYLGLHINLILGTRLFWQCFS